MLLNSQIIIKWTTMTNSIAFQERNQCPKIELKKKVKQKFHMTTVANDLLFVVFVTKWYHLVKHLIFWSDYVFKCDMGQDELHCYFGNNVWHIWHNQITPRKFATSCRISYNGSGNKLKILRSFGSWYLEYYRDGTMNKMTSQRQKAWWFFVFKIESIDDFRKKKIHLFVYLFLCRWVVFNGIAALINSTLFTCRL